MGFAALRYKWFTSQVYSNFKPLMFWGDCMPQEGAVNAAVIKRTSASERDEKFIWGSERYISYSNPIPAGYITTSRQLFILLELVAMPLWPKLNYQLHGKVV